MTKVDITIYGEHADRWQELRGRFRSDAALMAVLLDAYGDGEDYEGRGIIRDWTAPQAADDQQRTCLFCTQEIVDGEGYCTAILHEAHPEGELHAHAVCLS